MTAKSCIANKKLTRAFVQTDIIIISSILPSNDPPLILMLNAVVLKFFVVLNYSKMNRGDQANYGYNSFS